MNNPQLSDAFPITTQLLPLIEERVSGLRAHWPDSPSVGVDRDLPPRKYVEFGESALDIAKCRDFIWLKPRQQAGQPSYIMAHDTIEFVTVGYEPDSGEWSAERWEQCYVRGSRRMTVAWGTEDMIRQVLIAWIY